MAALAGSASAQARRVISQAAFDEMVEECMDVFEMSLEEALEDARRSCTSRASTWRAAT